MSSGEYHMREMKRMEDCSVHEAVCIPRCCCGKDFFAIYFKFVFKIIRSLIKIKSSVFAFTVNEKLKLYLQSSIFCDTISAKFRPRYVCSA